MHKSGNSGETKKMFRDEIVKSTGECCISWPTIFGM